MTESIARAPEAALDIAARSLACIEALLALVDKGAQPPEIALAALAALELVRPLSTIEATAEMLAAYGRRKWREGFRAGEQAATGEAVPRPRLVSTG